MMVVEYVGEDTTGPHTLFSFEPDAETLFGELLPRYVATGCIRRCSRPLRRSRRRDAGR